MQSKQPFNRSLAMGMVRAAQVWAGWNPARILRLCRFVISFTRANKRRSLALRDKKLVVPPLIILSVTMRCNLSCFGCYSRNYPRDNEMSLGELGGLFAQAEELGAIYFVITGGEPLMREGLLDLLASRRNQIFLLFTNGAYIAPGIARQIYKAGNIIPALSIEGTADDTDRRRGAGTYARVREAMSLLKQERVLFGFSVMVNSKNIATVGSEQFIDEMISSGCKIGYYVQYVPSGPSPDLNLLPDPEQRVWFRQRVRDYQRRKRLILVHMPDDEYEQGGACMAAGRGFVHINAQGDVEPCPFAHFATHSVRTHSLQDALAAPMFAHIRGRPELSAKPSQGCALVEHRKILADAMSQFGVRNTELGPK